MDVFPFAPQHEQPIVSEEEASDAARTLATARQIASEAGRVLEAHQHQQEEAKEQATEEVVPDSGDQAIIAPAPDPAEAEEVVVPEQAAKKPAAKKSAPKKNVGKAHK